jgi:DNA-binding MarR family transcriptional regulator/ribosomal protein S18 acetylase RimI-like enzyme
MSVDAAAHIAGVRQFNRFYTRQIGLLRDGLLDTPFSLTEGRLLYEIAQRGTTTAAELAADLEIDPGYLSRLIRGFIASGIVTRERSRSDRRQGFLALTGHGRDTFAELDRRSQSEIGALLEQLDDDAQRRLLAAMATIETLLAPAGPPAAPRMVVLRPHRSEDLGWVLARHATLYAKEYGWGPQFKSLVAGIIADFLRGHDPEREGCWIAECDGEPAGSVMLVDAGGNVAKLRLLLVEPRARGLGIGRRLVEECIGFASAAGYNKITLWTQSVLTSARTIYERAGFVRIEEKPHRSFGVDLVGETWELEL